MAALPYMQLYVAEYLADTMHLTAAQHGAYLLLLMNYWQRGKALPNNDDRLAAIVRMTPQEWKKNRDAVAEFFEVTDAEWVHKRVEVDLEAVYTKSTTNTKNGKLGGRPRKPNGSPEETEPKPNGLPNGSENETESKGIKNRTDKEQNITDKNLENPVLSTDVAARVLSEKVGNLNIRFQEQLERTIRASLHSGESLEACVDRMAGQWQKYNLARDQLNYPVQSAQKFFESGTWHDEKLWPWKEATSELESYRRSTLGVGA